MIFNAILSQTPTAPVRLNPECPVELERVIDKALEKNRDLRCQSAKEMLTDLKRLKRDTDTGKLAAAVPKAKPRPSWWWAASLLLIAVTAASGFWFLKLRKSEGPSSPPVLRRITWDTGLTTDPALSPDGKLVAYASDRSGEVNLDIWVQRLAGGEARGEPLRLTRDPADDSEPTFSPDGNSIAFSSARSGGGIYLIPAGGGQERLLTKQGHRPRFSPDGRWIAYHVGEKSFILPLSGGTARQLQPDFAGVVLPTWSPDGKHILFYCWKQSNGEDKAWWVTPVEKGQATRTDIPVYNDVMDLGPKLLEWTRQQTQSSLPIGLRTIQTSGKFPSRPKHSRLSVRPSV